MKPEQAEIARLKREVAKLKAERDILKKAAAYFAKEIDVKFGFIAKHRGVWPAEWLCEALGVSRGGFYAWLTRPRCRRVGATRISARRSVAASLRATGPMAPGACGTTCSPKGYRAGCIGSND